MIPPASPTDDSRISDLPHIMAGALPRLWLGSEVGCLVLHGFMASPGEVWWMGTHLAQQGYTTYLPRLAGHGIDPTMMRRSQWQDWYGSALDACHLLRQHCEWVVIIGHSMGGLLATLLAASQPVDALVLTATPFQPPNRTMRIANWLAPFLPYTSHPRQRCLSAGGARRAVSAWRSTDRPRALCSLVEQGDAPALPADGRGAGASATGDRAAAAAVRFW